MANIKVKKEKCIVEGCSRLNHSRGYCLSHYLTLRKKGVIKKIYVECGLCSKEAYKKGFCKEHYYKWDNYKMDYDIINSEKMEKERDLKRFGKCVIDGCENPSITSKTCFCRNHYTKKLNENKKKGFLKDEKGKFVLV